MNWFVVKMRLTLTFGAPDDPEPWKTQPMTLQIVGRPYKDEELIATVQSIDHIVNPHIPGASTAP